MNTPNTVIGEIEERLGKMKTKSLENQGFWSDKLEKFTLTKMPPIEYLLDGGH